MGAKRPAYTLMKFTADWCPPCKAMEKAGVLEAFVERHPEVRLKKVDVDAHGKLADQYGIRAIPTLVFLDGDGAEVARGSPATLPGVERLYTSARSLR